MESESVNASAEKLGLKFHMLQVTIIMMVSAKKCGGIKYKEDYTPRLVYSNYSTFEKGSTADVLWGVFKDAIKKNHSVSAEEIANIVIANPAINFMGSVEELEDGQKFFVGFDDYTIIGYESGAVFMPMMGSIPFVGYVFELDWDADAVVFAKTLYENCNPRWAICFEAEQIVAGKCGNKVFFLMCSADLGGEVGSEVDEKLIAPDVDKETLGYVFFEKFAEIKKADATKSAEAIANEILESKLGTAIQFPMVMPADPEFLSGFKAEAEISGYKSAAILTPGMMGVAFISYIFDLEEGTDVKEFVKNVEKNVDPSWNMCTTAETVTVGAYDNSVFLIMCPAKIPSSISGKADILEPTVTEGSASEAIWNEFKALMSGENAPAFAIDVATALSEGVFAGEVTEADWCIEDENLFAYAVDGYSGASYITSGDKAVYVFQLEEGMEIENWTGYYFDGIKADQYAFGSYNSMIILMINAD